MWQLEHLTTSKARWDQSSLGQSATHVTELWDGQVQLINAIELVNGRDSACQFLICSCGIVGCQPGNWVEIRRAGSIAIITPAFSWLREMAENQRDDYLPPSYLVQRGVIYGDRASYENTLSQTLPLPKFETLWPLPVWSATKIFQFEAPHNVLANTLHPPTLNPEMVIASSVGDFREQTAELIRLINCQSQTTHPVNLRPVNENDQVISLYLDIAGYPEWAALNHDGSQYSLYLQPGYAIEPAA
jgi:hypothetical protein